MNLFKCQKKVSTDLPLLGLLMCVCLIGCSEKKTPLPEDFSDARIQRMIESEEMVLKLTPKLRALGASIVSGSWATCQKPWLVRPRFPRGIT